MINDNCELGEVNIQRTLGVLAKEIRRIIQSRSGLKDETPHLVLAQRHIEDAESRLTRAMPVTNTPDHTSTLRRFATAAGYTLTTHPDGTFSLHHGTNPTFSMSRLGLQSVITSLCGHIDRFNNCLALECKPVNERVCCDQERGS